jgi:hypothetical protein
MDSQFNFIQQTKRIKTESHGSTFSLISPPTTPSPPAACRSRSISSGSKRPRPYPAVTRDPFYTMSAYQSWSNNGRSHPVERKPTDGDKLAGYAAPPQFINVITIVKYKDKFSSSLESKLYRKHVYRVGLGITLIFLKSHWCHG